MPSQTELDMAAAGGEIEQVAQESFPDLIRGPSPVQMPQDELDCAPHAVFGPQFLT